MASSKVRVQSLIRPLMRSDNPAVAREAHKMTREANDVASRGQKRIRKLFRRLCVIQDRSEASNAKTPLAVLPRCLVPAWPEEMKIFFSGGALERTSGSGDEHAQTREER